MTSGLITEEEEKVLTELSRINRTDRIDSKEFKDKGLDMLKQEVKGDAKDSREVSPNVYYVPLLWAANLVNEAKKDDRITDHSTQRILIEVSCSCTLTHLVCDCVHQSRG